MSCQACPRQGSREEVFPSAEVRPRDADGPLRVGPKSWLPLEALTSDHKLPRDPTRAGGASRLRPLATSTFLSRGPHATTATLRLASATPLRCRHRHLALRPLCRLPQRGTAAGRCRTAVR